MNRITSVWKGAPLLGKFGILGCGGVLALVLFLLMCSVCSSVLNLGGARPSPTTAALGFVEETQPTPNPTESEPVPSETVPAATDTAAPTLAANTVPPTEIAPLTPTFTPVVSSPTPLPTVTSIPPTEAQIAPTLTIIPTSPAPLTPEQPEQPSPASTGSVTITLINYDGDVPQVESDEYAEITNATADLIDLSDWRLSAGDGQDFFFPAGVVLQPNQSCRVYTNEIHPETCGLSFANDNPVWNNTDRECGYLFNREGIEVSRNCY